jgi:glycosyltransferase involved in cell wall biosynthesis
MNNKLVSIVIPAKDEEETLPLVLKDLFNTIKNIKEYSFEVIVVNDHSIDRTVEVARSFDNVKVVNNTRSAGKGHALITGFENSIGDYIIMLDADYSHRPEDIPVFLSLLERGYGLVVGSRITGGSEEYVLIRAFGNIVLTIFFWFVTGVFLTDALNGYKAFRREIFTNHKYTSRDFEIEIELLINTLIDGYKIGEIPSHERARAGGKMKSKVFKHGIKFFWKIFTKGIKYRLMKILKKKY